MNIYGWIKKGLRSMKKQFPQQSSLLSVLESASYDTLINQSQSTS